MLLREVEYARPETVDEAVRLLAAREDARALAGGQSLINVMKTRVAAPDAVIDLNAIAELQAIRVTEGGALEIGAMVTYDDLVRSEDAARLRPVVGEVALSIADVQVRNRGTVGGNLCSNDPTNHLPPVMVSIGATMTVRGPESERRVAAEDFFEGVYATAVGAGELLTSVTVPALGDGEGDGWASTTLGKDGTGIVNVAVTVRDGTARVAVGCVAAVPLLVSAPADEVAVRDALSGVGLDPPEDVHASAEYRRHLAGVLAGRALRQALDPAQ
jgi:carbon-monoxide dehydrogenase medium subunit